MERDTTLDDLPLFRNPIAARDDPGSSHVAAENITSSGARGRQARAVLALVKQLPHATAVELAVASGGRLDRYQVNRRLADLMHAGLVEQGDQRLCKVRQTLMCTWRERKNR